MQNIYKLGDGLVEEYYFVAKTKSPYYAIFANVTSHDPVRVALLNNKIVSNGIWMESESAIVAHAIETANRLVLHLTQIQE